tara:strand:- start:1436 stop:1822 length:387 start_codon:yes stop_codon:yes gene_type:complete
MKKIIIVVSNYYEDISNSLLQNALKELKNFKVNKVIKVPGVFEIPVTIAKNINKVDGAVALGCVIKGKTPHFEFISAASTNAIMQISLQYKKPIGNGILTCLNKNQAIKRVSKGSDAAKAVISVITQK